MRRTLHRLHIWLGWAVAVPLILWTVTGLWMAARPIEEVRGEHLRRTPPPLVIPAALKPPATTDAIKSLAIEARPTGPIWVLVTPSGGARRYDLVTGRALPPVRVAEAIAIARAAYAGSDAVARVARTEADHPPLDLRRPRPAWGVGFAGGTTVYVDADTGAVLALRTTQWRLFDVMWGLHILDPVGREETSHPLLIGAAILSVIGVLTGTILLFVRQRKRRRAGT